MPTNNSLNLPLSGNTGTGLFVGGTSPTLVTPVLGTPTSGDLRNCTAATSALAGVASYASSDFDIAAGNITNREINFRAYKAADQSIATSTNTKLILDTENYDSDSYFDSTTNYRFTPLVAGKYAIGCAVFMQIILNGSLMLAQVYKNGAVHHELCRTVVGGTVPYDTGMNGATYVDMNGSTDYIEIYVWHNSPTAISTFSGSGAYTWVFGYRVSK